MEAPVKSSQKAKSVLDILIIGVALVLFLLLVSYPIFLWESPERLILLFVPLCLIAWALASIKNKSLIPWDTAWNTRLGVAIAIVCAVIGIYFFAEYRSLIYERSGSNTALDFVLGGIAVLLIILATWKTSGRAIPIVALCFLFYAALGKYFPGVLHHAGLSWRMILMFSAVDIAGIFGTLPVAGFTMVVIFLFFASLVQGFGGLDYVISLSRTLVGRYKWGLPQMAVIASLIFGTFSGSAAANAAGVGTFTIPLMKKFGVSPSTAAAIEAVASSGGQVMPPVMGVAAFLMANFLNVHYIKIVAMGLAPALVYYISVGFSVYLTTRKMIVTGPAVGAQKDAGEFRMLAGLPILIPIVVLLLVMAVFKLSVASAGLYMLISFIVTRLMYDLAFSRKGYHTAGQFIKQFGAKTLSGITSGVSSTVSIMFLLAIMGIVARVLVASGLSQKLAFFMVDFSGGRIVILLLLIFLVSVLLGMAVSTVVAYVLVVLLAAPALLRLGVPLPVSHFTIFYLSILSAITPPVALACVVTSGIAKSPYMRTCWESCKLGLPLFVLPFVFIWKPDIIAANIATTPLATLEILVGFLPVSYGIQGEFKGISGNLLRIVCLALGALGIFYPRGMANWIMLAGGALLTIFLLTRGSWLVVGRRHAQTAKN
ncbi:MAG: TRAP transporter fused permease subunit [Dehalococcoidales bacterium]|nr:TRAP transporter fused permease subunit [Dehalococcoidales bacterium]